MLAGILAIHVCVVLAMINDLVQWVSNSEQSGILYIYLVQSWGVRDGFWLQKMEYCVQMKWEFMHMEMNVRKYDIVNRYIEIINNVNEES